MKIYFDGCSNTWGAGLETPELSRYSRLVSEHFGAEEDNIARRGGSDKRVLRNLLETVLSEFDYIIVQMTFKNRTEYWCDNKKRWMSINLDSINRKGVERKLNGSFFWIDYFKHVYTDKLANINQLTYYHAMRNVLKDKKHIIIGINGWGHVIQAPVEYNFTNFESHNTIKYKSERSNHPSEEGHKLIAEVIIKHIENHK